MSDEDGQEDRKLIELCARRDERAFDDLVARHGGAVLAFLERRASSHQHAEDAWQETFLTAWSKASSYRGEGSLRSWLFTIARRQSGRLATRAPLGLRPGYESLEALGERAGWGRSGTGAEPRVERLGLRQAFHRLAVADQELLWIRDVEGFSNHEVATVLGIGLAAAKSRLHRARLRLMSELLAGKPDEE